VSTAVKSFEVQVHAFLTSTLHVGEWCIWNTLQNYITNFIKSRDSSVGIALGYGMDDRGSRVRFSAGAGNFSLHHRIKNDSGALPTSYPRGTRWFSLGVKRAGREADHSPPSSAEVKE
jgi:hypothetical protein